MTSRRYSVEEFFFVLGKLSHNSHRESEDYLKIIIPLCVILAGIFVVVIFRVIKLK